MQHDRRAEAKADLEIVQKEKETGLGNFDIGPFYGLPLKVKELFEKQRGIKKLYGELRPNKYKSPFCFLFSL